jgi:hypothetical protein
VVGSHATYGARIAGADAATTQWILNSADDALGVGSAHSMWLAWTSAHAILDGRSRVLLMDADIVYDPALLRLLADDPASHSKMLVAASHRDTGEEVLVWGDPRAPHVPRRLGKGLRGSADVAGAPCLGEAAGIVLWEPVDHALLRELTQWTVCSSERGVRSEHEDVTQLLMLRDRMRAVVFGPAHPFLEVDTPEDWDLLRNDVFPRLSSAGRSSAQ